MVAPGHGAERGPDLGSIGVRGHVEDDVVVRHARNVYAERLRRCDRNGLVRDDVGVRSGSINRFIDHHEVGWEFAQR